MSETMNTHVQMDTLTNRLRYRCGVRVSYGLHGTALDPTQPLPEFILPAQEHGVCRWQGTSDTCLAYYEGLYRDDNDSLEECLGNAASWAGKPYQMERSFDHPLRFYPCALMVQPEGPIARDLNFDGDRAKLTAARLRVLGVIWFEVEAETYSYTSWTAAGKALRVKETAARLDRLWTMAVGADPLLPTE